MRYVSASEAIAVYDSATPVSDGRYEHGIAHIGRNIQDNVRNIAMRINARLSAEAHVVIGENMSRPPIAA